MSFPFRCRRVRNIILYGNGTRSTFNVFTYTSIVCPEYILIGVMSAADASNSGGGGDDVTVYGWV